MKVAYVCVDPGLPVFGCKGCSVHVQEVLRAMISLGADVTLFTIRTGGEPAPGLQGVRVCRLKPPPAGLDTPAREQFALRINDELARALDAHGPFDLVYERYSLWSDAGMCWAADRGVPGALEVNTPLIEEQVKFRELVDRSGAQRVAERAFGAASVLLAVSRGVATYVGGFASARGKVAVIPNAVNPARFSRRRLRSAGGSPHAFTVGFLGTLKAWHGLEVLVDAFEVLYWRLGRTQIKPHLLVVGDGPQREALESSLASRGLSDFVEFTGAVAPHEVPTFLHRMDVGVAPYKASAGFYFSPLKVFEYMAAGLPVVASRVGQLDEVIDDGETGLLCPPGDALALSHALDQLCRNPERVASMGRAGRRFVFEHHTWRSNVQRVFELAGLHQPQTHYA